MSEVGKVNMSSLSSPSSMRAHGGKNRVPDASSEPKARNGATALDAMVAFRNANKNEDMNPENGAEPEPKARSGATALDGVLAFRNANKNEDMNPENGAEPEPKTRSGATALDALLQMRNEKKVGSMTQDNQPEAKAKTRVAASALATSLGALDGETGTFGTKKQGRRLNLDPGRTEGGRQQPKVKDVDVGHAVSVVQDFKETAKHVQEKMLDLERFLGRALEDLKAEGRVESAFGGRLQDLMDAINAETQHTTLAENPLLGEGGQDYKIPHGDGTFGVLNAENFSFSAEGAESKRGQNLEGLLDRVRGRMTAIRQFQETMEDQLQQMARSDRQFAGKIAQGMGVDQAELDPESAALLASQIAGQMVGMTTVMMNLDLDHEAKRIAGLLRSPVKV